jgi:hypothetical protein
MPSEWTTPPSPSPSPPPIVAAGPPLNPPTPPQQTAAFPTIETPSHAQPRNSIDPTTHHQHSLTDGQTGGGDTRALTPTMAASIDYKELEDLERKLLLLALISM